MATRDSSEKIGLRPLLIYAQAQTGLNLCATLLGLHLLYFYTDRQGLSPSLAGLAFFLALVLDAMTDPLVGNISDRARFKSGRRRLQKLLTNTHNRFSRLGLASSRVHTGVTSQRLLDRRQRWGRDCAQ